jgi:hypothetical protein
VIQANMTKTTAADRRNRSRVSARLLLALLLVLAPLLANAAGIPMMISGPDAATPVSAQMPCHSGDQQPLQAAASVQQDACPHCTGDGPASQCHCCGQATPAGLSFLPGIHPDRHADGAPLRLAVTDPLPDSPGDRLYRPPIALS